MTFNDTFLETVAKGLENSFSQPFDLSKLKDFPYIEYTTNMTRYLSSMSWFMGDALKEVETEKAGEATPLYPVRVNPLQATCMKHASALFGEETDDGRPLVIPKLIAEDENDKATAEQGAKVLNRLWFENFGRSIMMENGIISQVYGGCVFGLKYVPWETFRTIPIKIERITPECFIGKPISGDPFRLQEAWVVKPILAQDAEAYGVHVDTDPYNSALYPVFWTEHWTAEEYTIRINDKIPPDKVMQDGTVVKFKDINPWGVVPYVYIPHVRSGTFYGQSLVDNLKGIVAELNLRIADYGDAVSEDAHSYVAYRNVAGELESRRVAPGLNGINLGSNSGITGNEPEPDMFEVTKAKASSSMKDLVNTLIQQYRQSAFMPPVADGEDEGSQRSALTLVMRMWPLVGHTNMERLWWSDGLDWLTSMALRMMMLKEIGGITIEHTKLRTRQEWRPVLPKDREAFMNELVNRMGAYLGSPEFLMEATGEIEDVPAEFEKVKEWVKFLEDTKAEAQAKIQAAFGQAQAQNQSNGGSSKPAGEKNGNKSKPKGQ
jgi:hypothetical protein